MKSLLEGPTNRMSLSADGTYDHMLNRSVHVVDDFAKEFVASGVRAVPNLQQEVDYYATKGVIEITATKHVNMHVYWTISSGQLFYDHRAEAYAYHAVQTISADLIDIDHFVHEDPYHTAGYMVGFVANNVPTHYGKVYGMEIPAYVFCELLYDLPYSAYTYFVLFRLAEVQAEFESSNAFLGYAIRTVGDRFFSKIPNFYGLNICLGKYKEQSIVDITLKGKRGDELEVQNRVSYIVLKDIDDCGENDPVSIEWDYLGGESVEIQYDDGGGYVTIVSSHDISDQPYVWNAIKSVGTYTIKIIDNLGNDDTTDFSVS